MWIHKIQEYNSTTWSFTEILSNNLNFLSRIITYVSYPYYLHATFTSY